MAAVDQGEELDARWTAEPHHGIERRACRAAGVDDIVDQHDCFARDREGNIGAVEHRRIRSRTQIVTVERDVQLTDRQLHTVDARNVPGQPARQRHAARVDADQAQVVRAVVLFEDLMRDAHERAVDGGRIHDLCLAFELHSDASVHRKTPCPSPDKAAARREST